MDAALEAMNGVKGVNRKQFARHFSVNAKSMGNRYSEWEASERAKQKLSPGPGTRIPMEVKSMHHGHF